MSKQPRMRIKENKLRLGGNNLEEHELELVEVDENTQDIEALTSLSEENAEPNLVETKDGRLIIAMKPGRTCEICKKEFASAKSLKKHQLSCTDKEEEFKDVLQKEKKAAMVAQPGEEFFKYCNPNPENPCYCCGEDISTAHVGHIKCKLCPKSFKAYEYMEKHLASVHAETNEFECSQCNAKCPSEKVLNDHLLTHSEGKPFSCLRCGKDFTRKYHLERHLNHSTCGDAPKQTLPCEVCGKEFTRLDNLREHLRFHMGQGSRKRDYLCPYCPKSFYGSSLLNIHIRTHTGEKPFPCDLCTKSFPSTGALRKHRRSHTGERPYRCDQCSATFAARETLNRHRKTHTGEKPHQCTVCDKRFIQATQLRSHMFYHGESGFECEVCLESFNRKSRLVEHIRYVHNKESPPQCHICKKEFKRKEDLSRHMDSHNAVKNFECDECGKSFASKAAMKLHQRTHMVEKPSFCPLCDRRFIRQDCLIRHMRTRHRESSLKITRIEENSATTPEGVVLLEVEDINESTVPEQDPQVLEIDGEVYKITPVDDIQIVEIKEANSGNENNKEIQVLEVVTIAPPSENLLKNAETEELKNLEQDFNNVPSEKMEENKIELKKLTVKQTANNVLKEPKKTDEKKTTKAKIAPKSMRVIATPSEVAMAQKGPLPFTKAAIETESSPSIIKKPVKERKKRKRPSVEDTDVRATKIKLEDQDDSVPIFLSDDKLKIKISELLHLLIDEETLAEFGWPKAPVEEVLSNVIRRCGHKPASDEDAGDHTTRMRENSKILFSLTMDDDNIKMLLNNHTVDEVIMNVLKNK